MTYDERSFEAHLREFQPIRPRPLAWEARPDFARRRAAAVAICAVAVVALCWLGVTRHPAANLERTSAKRQPALISVRELTRVALDDPGKLDIQIDEAAPAVLPCCEGPQSSLAALAKE